MDIDIIKEGKKIASGDFSSAKPYMPNPSGRQILLPDTFRKCPLATLRKGRGWSILHSNNGRFTLDQGGKDSNHIHLFGGLMANETLRGKPRSINRTATWESPAELRLPREPQMLKAGTVQAPGYSPSALSANDAHTENDHTYRRTATARSRAPASEPTITMRIRKGPRFIEQEDDLRLSSSY